jgi:hypothetical protein
MTGMSCEDKKAPSGAARYSVTYLETVGSQDAFGSLALDQAKRQTRSVQKSPLVYLPSGVISPGRALDADADHHPFAHPFFFPCWIFECLAL